MRARRALMGPYSEVVLVCTYVCMYVCMSVVTGNLIARKYYRCDNIS